MTSALLPLRVTLLDTWEETDLRLPPGTLVSEVKRAALARARIKRAPAEYVVKYRGAELAESGRTLADAGVPPHGELIVLLRRRLPVR
jgi:hypothetical protein